MFGITPDALFGGAMSMAGGLMSNLWTDSRQRDAMAFNAAQAQQQMAFQEHMSSTAYQRSMKDMRKAGLNPMLAYSKGGASSPTGAAASTTFSPASDVLTPAVSTAMQAKRLTQELDNMEATNANLKSQNTLIGAQTAQAAATTAKTVADTAISREMLHEAERKGELGKIDQKFYQSTIGTILRNLGLGLGEVNPLTRAVPRPYIHVTP